MGFYFSSKSRNQLRGPKPPPAQQPTIHPSPARRDFVEKIMCFYFSTKSNPKPPSHRYLIAVAAVVAVATVATVAAVAAVAAAAAAGAAVVAVASVAAVAAATAVAAAVAAVADVAAVATVAAVAAVAAVSAAVSAAVAAVAVADVAAGRDFGKRHHPNSPTIQPSPARRDFAEIVEKKNWI